MTPGPTHTGRTGAGRGALVALCLAALLVGAWPSAPVAAQGRAREINVELILDASGSMAQRIGGETRMAIAKRVLDDVIAAIPEREGINVGFRLYGHRGDNTAAGKAESCRASDLLVPIEGVDREALQDAVDGARATGWTPLAYSLEQAAQDFPPARAGVVDAVVLVTDGLETCGGDPCAASADLHDSDIALTTHVVSFAQSAQERAILQCIAENGGGLLLGADDADELAAALFAILGELDVVPATGSLEIEAFGDVWPHATATCNGAVSDADPQGRAVTVRFETTNRAELPVGDCELSWPNPAGTTTRLTVAIEPGRVTWVRGSLFELPQGSGESYAISDASGLLIWEAPLEAFDRVWLLPGLYRLELTERVGDAVLPFIEVQTLPGIVTTIDLSVSSSTEVPEGPAPENGRPTPHPGEPVSGVATIVPDVVGLRANRATDVARRFGLNIAFTIERTDETDPGIVIRQRPGAGEPASLGDTMSVVVAGAPGVVAVPDVTELTEEDAIAALEAARLVPGDASLVSSSRVPEGRVIETDPRSGELVEPGSRIDYVLSAGVALAPRPTPRRTREPAATPDAGLPDETGRTPAPGEATPEPTPSPIPLVTVPDVTGLPEGDALALLDAAGLVEGERSERPNGRIEAGSVIRTQPAAGEVVEEGTPVDLVVSLGPPPTPEPAAEPTPEVTPSPTPEPTPEVTPSPPPEPTPSPIPLITVPDVTGLPEGDALALLDAAGLVEGERSERPSGRIEAGSVIRTQPAAGEVVEEGTPVDLVVSLGPPPTPEPAAEPTPEVTPSPPPEPTPSPIPLITVPDVTGLPEGDALALLDAAGLVEGERSERPSGRIEAGSVIRTQPAAGEVVEPGTAVDLVVSLGPPEPPPPSPSPSAPAAAELVGVPDVRGLAEEDAVAVLESSGLSVGERTERESPRVPQGSVIRTRPDAGQLVDSGTAVDIVISTGARPTEVPTASAAPSEAATPVPSAPPSPSPIPLPPESPIPSPLPSEAPEPNPASAAPVADDLLSRVQAADALRVIAEPEEPGWSVIRPNGQARGFAAQVASRVAKELGVKATFSPEQPDAAREGGWGDRADISFEHLAATDARASALVFSQPYAWEPIGFAAAASSGVNPDDLAGRWVCVEAGSIAEGWLQGSVALVDGAGGQANAPSVGQIVSAGSDEDCLAAVQGGSADAWATSAMTISSSVDDGAELSASSAPAGWAPIAAAVDPSVPGYESLLAAVDAAITTLRDDGTLAQLSERALGSDVSSPPAGTAEVGLTTEETNGG